MDGNYSLSDIAAVTNDGMFGGNNGIFWLFAILLLGGGGFGFGRNQAATTDELSAGFNFSGINNSLKDLMAGQANINQNLGNAICQLGYQGAQHTYDLASKIDKCCCDTQLGIQGVKFDMANYAAATNAAITAGTQKILDRMCADKEASMAARIQSLELQQALCGVVRYPNATTYTAGANPFFAGCGCNPCTNI